MLPGQLFGQDLVLGVLGQESGLRMATVKSGGLGHNCWFIALRDEARAEHWFNIRQESEEGEFWASRGKEKGMLTMCRMLNFGGIRLFCN